MNGYHPGARRQVGCMLVVVTALCSWACDQDLPTFMDGGDTSADLAVETPMDSVSDPSVEPEPDTTTDLVVDDGGGDCTYPAGPYAFNAVGDTVGPMTWPTAVAGTDETLAADLYALHCDPSVKSIFIQIAATS